MLPVLPNSCIVTDMQTNAIVRTGRYMTHVAIVDGAKIERLACTSRVPKNAKITTETHVVCNKCSGANR